MSKNLQKTALPPEPRQNRILASLPAKDYARLLPDLNRALIYSIPSTSKGFG